MKRVGNQPLISIVVPVYNAQQYLKQCLESVLGQSYSNFEMLCVDDGSTDNSLALLRCAENQDSRIVVLHQDNQGAAAARNRGLGAAKGSYIAFLDADDYVNPAWLKTLLKKALATQADIVIFPLQAHSLQTGYIKPLPWSCKSENFPPTFTWRDNPDKLFDSFHNWPCNKFFKADLLRTNGITFQLISHTEDFLFTCKALTMAQCISTVPQALYTYRVDNPTSNLSRSERAPLDFYKAHLAVKNYLEESNIYGELEKGFLNWTADGIALHFTLYSSYDTYRKMFDFYQTEGLVNLGYDHLDMDAFDNPYHYQLLNSIKNSDFEKHLFMQFQSEHKRAREFEALADAVEQDYRHSAKWKAGSALFAVPSFLKRTLPLIKS